jgi:hypothetical protein
MTGVLFLKAATTTAASITQVLVRFEQNTARMYQGNVTALLCSISFDSTFARVPQTRPSQHRINAR